MSKAPTGGASDEPLAQTLKRLAPFLALGPISGPFLAGVVNNFRGGRPILGALYAIALFEWLALIPLTLSRLR
jgi:hypothetical protein